MLYEIIKRILAEEGTKELCDKAESKADTLTKGECFKLGVLIGQYWMWIEEYNPKVPFEHKVFINSISNKLEKL